MAVFPTAKPVEGKGGDQGLDTYVGLFNGECRAFEHKYFIEKLGQSQRRQIEKSLSTAAAKHRLVEWTLMLPIDLNPAALLWFARLEAKYSAVKLDWWGKTKLQELLAFHPEVVRDFQPKPSVSIIIIETGVDLRSATTDQIADKLREFDRGSAGRQTMLDVAQDIQKRCKLKVLIWGPGATAGDIYRKRCEIGDRLGQLGHTVDFGEDVWDPATLSQTGLNLSVGEFLQAIAYDYIICLMASPGSVAEVHDFAKIKEFASKMMICVDREHQHGYSAKGTLRIFEGLNGRLDWFETPTDISDCHLATRVFRQVEKVVEAKQWELAQGAVRQ